MSAFELSRQLSSLPLEALQRFPAEVSRLRAALGIVAPATTAEQQVGELLQDNERRYLGYIERERQRCRDLMRPPMQAQPPAARDLALPLLESLAHDRAAKQLRTILAPLVARHAGCSLQEEAAGPGVLELALQDGIGGAIHLTLEVRHLERGMWRSDRPDSSFACRWSG